MQLSLLYRLLEGRLHLRQFIFPANGVSLNSLYASGRDSKGARFYAVDSINLDQFAFALDRDRIKDGYFKNSPHMLVCIVRNKDSTCRRGLLQSTGEIHRIAYRRVLTDGTYRAEQGRTCINANSQVDILVLRMGRGCGSIELLFPFLDFGLYLKRGTDGTFGIVFPCDRGSKKGHHRVPNMFVYTTALILDCLINTRPKGVDYSVNNFMIQRFCHRCKAGNI